jgi:hypothetical protein
VGKGLGKRGKEIKLRLRNKLLFNGLDSSVFECREQIDGLIYSFRTWALFRSRVVLAGWTNAERLC